MWLTVSSLQTSRTRYVVSPLNGSRSRLPIVYRYVVPWYLVPDPGTTGYYSLIVSYIRTGTRILDSISVDFARKYSLFCCCWDSACQVVWSTEHTCQRIAPKLNHLRRHLKLKWLPPARSSDRANLHTGTCNRVPLVPVTWYYGRQTNWSSNSNVLKKGL